MKADYENAVNKIEAQNRALKEKVKAQKKSSNKQWQSFKDEFNHDMEEIGNSLKDINKNNVK